MHGWEEVDAWIAGKLLGSDPVLDAALEANAQAGLPEIDVSAAQGKLLMLLAQLIGARRILEVGTLGGYSAIWLARALPADGRLVTLELRPDFAAVARTNIAVAGLADRVEIRVGPAADTLDAMVASGEGPFDLVFIDADKAGNVAYLTAALALSRPGGLILLDNVVREGRLVELDNDDPNLVGTRAAYDWVAAQPRLDATALQTVGAKGWDGLMIARVRD